MLAMDVVLRLNVMDDPAEVVFAKGFLRRRNEHGDDHEGE
jgi:hypothetical protein